MELRASSSPTRVLVIDDQTDVARAMALGLSRNGFEATAYADPVKALEAFRPDEYDLVLLDIQMPRMNGFHVYRELKRIDKHVKVWFVTAIEIHEHEFARLFPEVKVEKFLKKPVTIKALVAEIQEPAV